MNWNKLPAHRRIVLMLREWRHTTLWLDDSQWFRLNESRNPADAGERLDDNNLEYPTK